MAAPALAPPPQRHPRAVPRMWGPGDREGGAPRAPPRACAHRPAPPRAHRPARGKGESERPTMECRPPPFPRALAPPAGRRSPAVGELKQFCALSRKGLDTSTVGQEKQWSQTPHYLIYFESHTFSVVVTVDRASPTVLFISQYQDHYLHLASLLKIFPSYSSLFPYSYHSLSASPSHAPRGLQIRPRLYLPPPPSPSGTFNNVHLQEEQSNNKPQILQHGHLLTRAARAAMAPCRGSASHAQPQETDPQSSNGSDVDDGASGSCWWMSPPHSQALHRKIMESLRLGKTSKIIQSNHQPNTTVPTKPCPKVLHLHIL
ncbi:uncharacterized protein LOC128851340 [Cuculus canorus]|uniref:uncharacterized protein LOC128851340 n=1 Tax=Cuculus canorus TaxID=55661 RepID=UPI0023AA7514|nr:uncharacterized protein LOC128851340 [Cuculus canorus]